MELKDSVLSQNLVLERVAIVHPWTRETLPKKFNHYGVNTGLLLKNPVDEGPKELSIASFREQKDVARSLFEAGFAGVSNSYLFGYAEDYYEILPEIGFLTTPSTERTSRLGIISYNEEGVPVRCMKPVVSPMYGMTDLQAQRVLDGFGPYWRYLVQRRVA